MDARTVKRELHAIHGHWELVLNRMMQIRPHWIKLDRQLVSGIDQDTLKQMMQDAGLERVEYFNLTAGVAALPDDFMQLLIQPYMVYE